MEQQAWTRLPADAAGQVRNTNLVAALATLGVPVKTELVIDDKTGREDLAFFLGVGLRLNGQGLRTKALMNLYAKGELEKIDPTHPLLDCLRGLHNAHCILDWMKRGAPHQLAYQANRQRTIYQPGAAGFSFVKAVSTRRLAVAAAFGVLGIPLLDVQGEDNHRTFFFPELGLPMEIPGLEFDPASAVSSTVLSVREQHNAAEILRAFLDTVEVVNGEKVSRLQKEHPGHPFLYAYFARENRQRLLAHIDRAVPLILLRSGVRSAFVHRDATDAAWQKADDFLAQ